MGVESTLAVGGGSCNGGSLPTPPPLFQIGQKQDGLFWGVVMGDRGLALSSRHRLEARLLMTDTSPLALTPCCGVSLEPGIGLREKPARLWVRYGWHCHLYQQGPLATRGGYGPASMD